MSSLDESVDMEISDGEEPMSDMEVSDSDIDPPQVSVNLPDLAQSRYQVGYRPYEAPKDDDDVDSLASFFTAPLAAEHEDEPGLIRDEEEADMETLAYYNQRIADYDEKIEQVEKEKKKLQQELLRFQVLSSMKKNMRSKLSVSNHTPAQKPSASIAVTPPSAPTNVAPSDKDASPPKAVSSTAARPMSPPAVSTQRTPASDPTPSSTTPWIRPENPPAISTPMATAAPPPAVMPVQQTNTSTPSDSAHASAFKPWIQPSSSSGGPVRPPASTHFNFIPAMNPPVVSSTAAKLTLSALAQPATPAPSNTPPSRPASQRSSSTMPLSQSNGPPVTYRAAAHAPSAPSPPPSRQSSSRIPTLRPVQNQRPATNAVRV
ncbi:hypothetical protein BJV82DRAFT_579184 [Fennellomyces sp. T-0311]|nr:hypothetical protein BJV82DRAFT_579184 [Fennellomyces sp. T-0311]